MTDADLDFTAAWRELDVLTDAVIVGFSAWTAYLRELGGRAF